MIILPAYTIISNPQYVFRGQNGHRANFSFETVPSGQWIASIPGGFGPESLSLVDRIRHSKKQIMYVTGCLNVTRTLLEIPAIKGKISADALEPITINELEEQEYVVPSTYSEVYVDIYKGNRSYAEMFSKLPQNHQNIFMITKKGHEKIRLLKQPSGDDSKGEKRFSLLDLLQPSPKPL